MPAVIDTHPPFFIDKVLHPKDLTEGDNIAIKHFSAAADEHNQECKDCKDPCSNSRRGVQIFPLGGLTLTTTMIRDDNTDQFNMFSTILLDIAQSLNVLPNNIKLSLIAHMNKQEVDDMEAAFERREDITQLFERINRMIVLLVVHGKMSPMALQYINYARAYWNTMARLNKELPNFTEYFSSLYKPRDLYIRIGSAAYEVMYNSPIALPEIWRFREKDEAGNFYFDKLLSYQGEYRLPGCEPISPVLSPEEMERHIKYKTAYMVF